MTSLLRPIVHVPDQPPLGHMLLLVGRVSLGLFMIVHGLGKWNWDGFGPTDQFVGYTESLGFPLPTLFAWNALLSEIGLSVLVLLGLFTRPAVLGLIFTMGVAAFVAHGGEAFVSGNPADSTKELPMMYIFAYLMLLGVGPGKFSGDALLSKRLAESAPAATSK
ncbi:MAG: DoxX family protein [Planctomycetota bacterium]